MCRFIWGPAVLQMPAPGPASGPVSAEDGAHRPLHVSHQPGSPHSSAPAPALDARRCALAVAGFPEGRTLMADEADPATVLLPLGRHLALCPWHRTRRTSARLNGRCCPCCCRVGQSEEGVNALTVQQDGRLQFPGATSNVGATDIRRTARQDGNQPGEAAPADAGEQTTVRFAYHAAGYDPAWLVPYAVQVRQQPLG